MNSITLNISKNSRRVAKLNTLSPIVNGIGLIFVFIISIITGYASFLVFWLLLFIGTYLAMAKKSADSMLSFNLFSYTFVFYTLYMGVTTLVLVNNPNTDFFYAFDSTKFWARSEGVFTLDEIWHRYSRDAVGFESVGGYRFFYFITLVLSFLSSLIDSNNLFVQKLAIVFVGALGTSYLFLIMKNYVDKYYAYLAILIFGIFSHVSTYSVEFLRDTYIYFFYVLGFYLITVKGSYRSTLWKLFLIAVIVLFIRPEHGAFFLLFIAAHIYLTRNTNKVVFLLSMLMTPLVLYLSTFLINMSVETYSTYEGVRQRVGVESDSLAARFANFPFGIKHIILAFLSQTVGIPFWRYLYYDGTDIASVAYRSHNGWRFMEAISGTVWMFVWGYILFAARHLKSYMKYLPKELIALFAVSVLLLLAGTADINVRRIFCVYPIIYVMAVVIRDNLPKNKRRIIIRNSLFFVVGLYIFYMLIKG